MKRAMLILLTLTIIGLSLPFAFSEDFDALRQAIQSLASGSAKGDSFDSLAASLPLDAAAGPVIARTWEGSDGAKYTFIYYTGVPAADGCAAPVGSADGDALTSEELLHMIDWVESQLKTEACGGGKGLDPAVFQTARPSEPPAPDPAVCCTARPSGIPLLDPAVFQTAQPAETPAPDPAVCCTARPSDIPLPDPAVVQTALPAASPTPNACRQAYPVWNPSTAAPAASPTPRPVTQPVVRPTAQPTVSTGDYTTFDSTMQEQKLLNLLNEDRVRNGLPPLALDPELSRLAKLKSNDMNTNHYFAHESPTYGNASQMLDAFDYDFQGVGENIAHHGNVEKAEAAFMSSDGHRRNILGSQWDKVGIGVAYDENGYVYVTQLFAR